MESNSQWKIYRQSPNDNVYILLSSDGPAPVVEMISKKKISKLSGCCGFAAFFFERICAIGQQLQEIYGKNSDLETIFWQNVAS